MYQLILLYSLKITVVHTKRNYDNMQTFDTASLCMSVLKRSEKCPLSEKFSIKFNENWYNRKNLNEEKQYCF